MIISLVLAVSENGVIGKNNQLPWRLPADLKHFKKVTLGHTVIMGRKTYDSIGKPLPQRRNIVITRNQEWKADGTEVFNSLEAAIEACEGEEEVFVIGGATIYKKVLEENLANRIYLTRIHENFDGDTFFKLPNADSWTEIERETHQPDEKNQYVYSFFTLESELKEKGEG
jgi:dihydrofolate reductase